ncbi:hypothetical protein DL766_009133 [Monosporascus sp. MC13-8B]|uniref:VASt domain-containing protein n=1 Tax=Monosporascus cannonballus TaxID=155416 RepID=A0ABY0HKJ8_9PEZI|nr:hypothetical protein DL762_001380 [Monosporascus cannonballus]RYP01007.1 hypothetical protein DL763_000428 [Monosporascus cannonballus]RYP16417.1 hypothetical protein DL766_009133 [Monosporascus sp. MC13-8B]
MDAASTSSAGSGSASGTGNTSRVAKFLPKTLTVKTRWKKETSEERPGSAASSEELHRGRGLFRDTGLNGSTASLQTTASQPMTDEAPEDAGFDGEATSDRYSDRDSLRSSSPVRPTIPSAHPSHIGQLTTSSPVIQVEHIPEIQSLDQDIPEGLPRSQTFASPSESHEPHRRLSVSKTGLEVPRSQSSSRSKSPAGRIREAFRTKKTTSTATETSKTGSNVDVDDAKLASPQPSGRPKSQVRINTSIPPRIPPSEPTHPVIVNTPPTPADTPPPKDSWGSAKRSSPALAGSNSRTGVSPSGNMISHRRARSGSGSNIGPSKLSNITLGPLTPTPENPTPTPPTPGGGFFSNVFSAAQNAANTLTNTISSGNIGPGGSKSKNTASELRPERDDRVQNEPTVEPAASDSMGDRELAIKTLGSGDLSLSQLGIAEGDSSTPTPMASKFPPAAKESTRRRSESAPGEAPHISANDDILPGGPESLRARSMYDPSSTTPPTSVYEGKSQSTSTGSVKSGLGRRRKRGSTADTGGTTTTGNTIAAGNTSDVQAASVPKLTGFAVASKKRNRDFHNLFKSVPDDDYLIDDFSCALQREILVHGRLYVSEGHLCFSSNIFGWVTTLVMSFDEIISVEKRSTALVFKNGLMISTLHAKHIFASFTSRDSTYDLIINIWKLGHPTLRSSLNGVSLNEVGGDKTVKLLESEGAATSRSALASEEEDEEEDGSEDGDILYDEDEDDPASQDATLPPDAAPAEVEGGKALSRKASGLNGALGAVEKADFAPATAGAPDFPGPATHAPTDCGDTDAHYDVAIADDVIAAPLGKVYDLIFGPTSVTFMSKWLTGEQKCTDLQMDDKKGLTQDNKSRSYTYIKPLNGAIGPKQTKCIVTETLEQLDLEKSVNVSIATQNPDVPSGNVFSVKTKYCMSWAENNMTHVTVNCVGPIEKGAKDGQTQYCKELFASLKTAVSSRSRASAVNGAKGKKKKAKGKLQEQSKESPDDAGGSSLSQTQDWGLFEPLHGILGAVVSIIKPILGGNLLYGLLVGLLLASWFGSRLNGGQVGQGYSRDMVFRGYPERAVAYDEMWRREETDLWDWLEERVGLHRMGEDSAPAPVRRRFAEPRAVEEKVRDERMSEREIEEAIRVTEEKLQVLKSVIDRKKVAPAADNERKAGRPTTRVPATERRR